MPLIVIVFGMIGKETENHINKIPGGPSPFEIRKKFFFRKSSFSDESAINVKGKERSKV